MFKKILVPVDGSAPAEAGLGQALEIARLARSSIVLVHILDAYPMAAAPMDEAGWQLVFDAMRHQGQTVLDAAAARAKAADVPAKTMLIEFPRLRVADAIVDAAREEGCDLVVMGTHGRRGVTRWVLGSDAERVLRASACPVLMVHPPPQAAAARR